MCTSKPTSPTKQLQQAHRNMRGWWTSKLNVDRWSQIRFDCHRQEEVNNPTIMYRSKLPSYQECNYMKMQFSTIFFEKPDVRLVYLERRKSLSNFVFWETSCSWVSSQVNVVEPLGIRAKDETTAEGIGGRRIVWPLYQKDAMTRRFGKRYSWVDTHFHHVCKSPSSTGGMGRWRRRGLSRNFLHGAPWNQTR